MSDLEKLKQMDIEEIHKKTFVLPKVLEALINGQYDKLGNKTKALGFVAILERDLGLDLSPLKRDIEEHFSIRPDIEEIFEPKEEPKKSSGMVWFLVVLLIGLAGVGYYFYGDKAFLQLAQGGNFLQSSSSSVSSTTSSALSSSLSSVSSSLSSSSLQSSSSSSSLAVIEQNSTQSSTQSSIGEENLSVATEENESEATLAEEPTQPALPTITIVPRSKVWVGIVYLDDFSKKQYLTSRPIELNTSRDQLIVTGHGMINIEQDGEVKEYNSRQKLRFIYRAGELEQIDKQSFKLYNRGRNW